ncbi:MAG TPA: aminotransferase class I/II-fold pyridoxal phosphate-dependent enzyme [Phycisphaeraceae bacterium]
MPSDRFDQRTRDTLQELLQSSQYKRLRWILGPMGSTVQVEGVGEVIVLCSNNYLGLANHPEVVEAGIEGLKRYGAGTASVRFICGTFDAHRCVEETTAQLVGAEAALTYVSCWNANEALIPTVAAAGDVILSDELNHASIIDACRLTRQVERQVYRHNDLADLEAKLKQHADKAVRWVITDGVFSMEGDLADLPGLVRLCRAYEAILIVDDSHGVGVLGATGRGTPEHQGVLGQVDLLTGTYGKALGGAAGGYVAGPRHVIDLLIQRSRPSLFSNALPATVACSADKAIEVLRREPRRVQRLQDNARKIRDGLRRLGYQVHESPSAIIPIIIGDTAEAIAKSQRLLELGVWVVGFGYPVVPEGQARLRVQASAALTDAHIEQALDAFAKL